jgi:CMP-N-acetylneuraminic acid synthetase
MTLYRVSSYSLSELVEADTIKEAIEIFEKKYPYEVIVVAQNQWYVYNEINRMTGGFK